MAGLQWCRTCRRVWLHPFWHLQSIDTIPLDCHRCKRPVAARLADRKMDRLRGLLVGWGRAQPGAEPSFGAALGQQFDKALGYSRRQGVDAAYPEKKRVRGLRGDAIDPRGGLVVPEAPPPAATVTHEDAMREWAEAKERIKRGAEADRLAVQSRQRERDEQASAAVAADLARIAARNEDRRQRLEYLHGFLRDLEALCDRLLEASYG